MARVPLMFAATSVLLLMGCNSDGLNAPPPGFPHAAAARFCGPTDGPAVAIFLSGAPTFSFAPPPPYVRVAVWQPLDRLTGQSWSLGGAEPEGGAWFFVTEGTFEFATSGEVIVTAVSADTTVEGTLDVRFPRAGRVRGGFKARWLSGRPVCG